MEHMELNALIYQIICLCYFLEKHYGGNAIDLLNSAAALGYTVEHNEAGNLDSKPRAGAVFVMDTTYIYGHPFGHTGGSNRG